MTLRPHDVPAWATETQTDAGLISHSTSFGSVPMTLLHGELAEVSLVRFDREHPADETTIIGPVTVTVADYSFSPADARRLAVLLVRAADLYDAAREANGQHHG
jgi:hypothetical protein